MLKESPPVGVGAGEKETAVVMVLTVLDAISIDWPAAGPEVNSR